MKILSASVQNFASYKQLDFEFDGQGLALVAGPTGSGKSTLCDVIPWILFGRTSKGGSVDEVLSWPGDKITIGTLYIEGGLEVTRTRGSKAKDNDLYFLYENDTGTVSAERGKDLIDTQQLINNLIGMDFNLYLSGAYFHEFSQTSQFFTTTAKVRRQITEQIVDLSLAKNLTERMSEEKKELKKQITETTNELSKLHFHLNYIKKELPIQKSKEVNWHSAQLTKILKATELEQNYKKQQAKAFDKLLAKFYERQLELESEIDAINNDISNTNLIISDLKSTIDRKKAEQPIEENCPTCGKPKHGPLSHTRLEEFEVQTKEALIVQKQVVLTSTTKALKKHLETKPVEQKDQINPYSQQVESLTNETNPHEETVLELKKELSTTEDKADKLKYDLDSCKEDYDDLELLLQVTDDFRAVLIKNTVTELETNTNKILNDYFDAEIRVSYKIEDADKLEVDIFKDGNQCVFSQLSKGQRQLLKLSFGISVMRAVSNHHGIQFNSVFLDEALSGLDDNLKTKTFSLLEKLATEYSSVFVVEHSSALKNMFLSTYNVALVNGHSEIEKS